MMFARAGLQSNIDSPYLPGMDTENLDVHCSSTPVDRTAIKSCCARAGIGIAFIFAIVLSSG